MMIQALRKVLKRMHYPLEVMLVCVRWYAAYPLSLRHIEEMMQVRGVFVDHAPNHRWTIKIVPILAAWKYLYRAVDRDGHTIDFVLRAHRDCAAARRFLERAIDLHGVPEKITIDKSGTNVRLRCPMMTRAIMSAMADTPARR